MSRAESRLLREREAARLLGMSPRTLQRWRCMGQGPPFVRCGLRAIAYRQEDLAAWIEARRHQSTAQYEGEISGSRETA